MSSGGAGSTSPGLFLIGRVPRRLRSPGAEHIKRRSVLGRSLGWPSSSEGGGNAAVTMRRWRAAREPEGLQIPAVGPCAAVEHETTGLLLVLSAPVQGLPDVAVVQGVAATRRVAPYAVQRSPWQHRSDTVCQRRSDDKQTEHYGLLCSISALRNRKRSRATKLLTMPRLSTKACAVKFPDNAQLTFAGAAASW